MKKASITTSVRLMSGILFFGLMLGCDSSSSSDSNREAGDVSGTWNGTGNYVHNNVPITQFRLTLNQNDKSLSGSYAIKRDARDLMQGSVSGSVNGNQVELNMNPHGRASGTVNGNRMNLDWYEAGFGGADFTGPRNGSVTLTR